MDGPVNYVSKDKQKVSGPSYVSLKLIGANGEVGTQLMTELCQSPR